MKGIRPSYSAWEGLPLSQYGLPAYVKRCQFWDLRKLEDGYVQSAPIQAAVVVTFSNGDQLFGVGPGNGWMCLDFDPAGAGFFYGKARSLCSKQTSSRHHTHEGALRHRGAPHQTTARGFEIAS